MALLFIDGFDHYSAASDLQKKEWGYVITQPTVLTTAGRRSSGCLRLNGAQADVYRSTNSTNATLIVGQAIQYVAAFGASPTSVIHFCDAGYADNVTQISVAISPLGVMQVWRGHPTISTLLGTATGTYVTGVWYFIEVKVVFNSTTGSVNIRVNGVSVLSLSNIDTTRTANNYATSIGAGYSFIGGSQTLDIYRDDFYLCDGSGSTNNDFLGDCRVDTILPNGAGNYAEFTPSAGANYACVDETTPNGDTDYVESNVVNERDSYQMANLPAIATQTVYGLQVNAVTIKDDAGARTIATMVRSNGINGDGATLGISVLSYRTLSNIFETNPDGAVAWTETTVNAMEAGLKVVA